MPPRQAQETHPRYRRFSALTALTQSCLAAVAVVVPDTSPPIPRPGRLNGAYCHECCD